MVSISETICFHMRNGLFQSKKQNVSMCAYICETISESVVLPI